VRRKLVVGLFLIAAIARAQDQERKLVDRLLEPNMKLENSEQNKQFVGGGTVRPKSASTRSFYVSNATLTKTFAGSREFTTQSHPSRQFGTQSENLPPAQKSRPFAGTSPFVEEGKSQKALHAQDHPLSIDDVRELLNKNK
jgi:hypothetical protein